MKHSHSFLKYYVKSSLGYVSSIIVFLLKKTWKTKLFLNRRINSCPNKTKALICTRAANHSCSPPEIFLSQWLTKKKEWGARYNLKFGFFVRKQVLGLYAVHVPWATEDHPKPVENDQLIKQWKKLCFIYLVPELFFKTVYFCYGADTRRTHKGNAAVMCNNSKILNCSLLACGGRSWFCHRCMDDSVLMPFLPSSAIRTQQKWWG